MDPSCGADTPLECADRWREMVPDMPEMVAQWIAHPGGFQVEVPDLTPCDEPARPVHGAARQHLDEGVQKLLRIGAWRDNGHKALCPLSGREGRSRRTRD
eukprot:COSAG03_NODE_487_length_7511_cov_21.869536_4_plen_100_part_00